MAIVIALFGPKVSFFDSRLLLIPILLIFMLKKRIAFSIELVVLLGMLLFLISYSFGLFLLFPSNPDFLRFIRSFVSLLCLPFIVSYNTNDESALKMLIYALILHPIVIFLSIISPSTQSFFAFIFQSVSQGYRYSGLSAGYDIAGYLSTSGFLVCIYYYFYNQRIKYLGFAIFFYISVFLTSRTSIIVILSVSLFLFGMYMLKSKLTFKNFFLSFSVLAILAITTYKFILPTFIATINIEMFEDLSEKGDSEAVLTYAKTDPYEMLRNFIILPKSNLGLIFGENFFPLSDSGYIQTINGIGIFGLIISFIFYFKLFPSISRKSKLKGDFSYHLSIALRIILIITLVLCVKNQYLFTRGTFELIILIFIVLNLSRTSALKNKINGKE